MTPNAVHYGEDHNKTRVSTLEMQSSRLLVAHIVSYFLENETDGTHLEPFERSVSTDG